MNINQLNKINSIFLRRANKVILPIGMDILPDKYIATIIKNIEPIGYTLSTKMITHLRTVSVDTAMQFYTSLVGELKRLTGANKTWNPMYPNFPAQVMESTEAELYINAIVHYIGYSLGVNILPKYELKERFPLMNNFDLKVIDVATESDFSKLMHNLMSAKTSISETDKADIATVIKLLGDDVATMLPTTVTHKENLAYIANQLMINTTLSTQISGLFNSVTDVLRLATAMSDGDVSLAENTKFRKFNRVERKRLIELVDSMKNVKEDMLRNRGRWVRLGERLHPSEARYAKYTNAVSAFNSMRDSQPVETFGRLVESALSDKNLKVAIEQLKRRPGEMARRLDHMIRIASTRALQNMVIHAFVSVSDKVSTPVLLQVMSHFNHRNESDMRVIFPKGNLAKVMNLENKLPSIDGSICHQIVAICENALRERFSSLNPMGKVYIDDSMKGMIVPFSQRSASKALRTLVRGSRIKLESDKDIVRFFIWWHDIGHSSIDVDLSAMMYDENWKYVEHVSYTNLRSDVEGVRACHSGDIRSAPKGACEFIDIDLPSIKNVNARYLVMNVISYTGQKFSDMPECFAGWMLREDLKSGEIFDARTVQNKIDLTSESRFSIPLVIDVQTREVIWGDIALNSDPRNSAYRNVENSNGSITLMGKSISSVKKTTIHELMTLHATARGTIVTDKSDADTVISMDGNITPFDVERIMSEFL